MNSLKILKIMNVQKHYVEVGNILYNIYIYSTVIMFGTLLKYYTLSNNMYCKSYSSKNICIYTSLFSIIS